MATKGFTKPDNGSTRKKVSKVKSGGPGGQVSGKAGGLQYGDTQSSMVPKMDTSTGLKWMPQVVSSSGYSGAPYGGGAPYTPAYPGGGASTTGGNPSGMGPGGQNPAGNTYMPPNNNLGSPMTGLGAEYGYTPQGLGMLYDNPGLLAQDVLGQKGVDNYGLSQQLGDAMAPALYAYTMQNPNFSQSQDQDVINYIAQYMQQMVTPGGSMPSYDELMTALLGVNDPTTDLGKAFATMSPQDQAAFIKDYAGQAGYTLNPLMQRMLGRKFDYESQGYLGGIAKGNPQGTSYADYLAKNGVTQTGR